MNDACAADNADTLPFTGLTPYGRPSWSGLLQFSGLRIALLDCRQNARDIVHRPHQFGLHGTLVPFHWTGVPAARLRRRAYINYAGCRAASRSYR